MHCTVRTCARDPFPIPVTKSIQSMVGSRPRPKLSLGHVSADILTRTSVGEITIRPREEGVRVGKLAVEQDQWARQALLDPVTILYQQRRKGL